MYIVCNVPFEFIFFHISFREVRLMGFVRKALVSVVFVSAFFFKLFR